MFGTIVLKNRHRKSLECTHFMLIRFAWKLVEFLPVSPKGTSIPALELGRRAFSWSSAVLGFRWPLSAGRRYGKRKKENRKLMAGSFVLLSSVSFPNVPATLWFFKLRIKNVPHILSSTFWLHSVGDRMKCAYSIVTATVTAPSAGFWMFIFERDILGNIHINTFSIDYKAVTRSHSSSMWITVS